MELRERFLTNLGGGLIDHFCIIRTFCFCMAITILFLTSAIIAIILAIIMFYLMKDTPESEGFLPPVDRREKIVEKLSLLNTLSAKDIFFKYIIITNIYGYRSC